MGRLCPEVPPELDALVLAALAKNPADRPDPRAAFARLPASTRSPATDTDLVCRILSLRLGAGQNLALPRRPATGQ